MSAKRAVVVANKTHDQQRSDAAEETGFSEPKRKKHKKKAERQLEFQVKAGADVPLDSYRAVMGAAAALEIVLKHEEYMRLNQVSQIKLKDIQDFILWVMADGVNVKWLLVKHKVMVTQFVTVMLHSIDIELFKRNKSSMPNLTRLFSQPVPTECPHARLRIQSPVDAILLCPLSKAQKAEREAEAKKVVWSTEGFSRNDCLLSLEQLEANLFPAIQVFENGKVQVPEDSGFESLALKSQAETVFTPTKEDPMYAIDCEMVRTSRGLELARISIVNEAHETLYDKFVKPDNHILDYNTKFSGITAQTLSDVTLGLEQVRKDLYQILPPNAILVGHSLDNDLKAMKICHHRIIDTSVLFSHTRGANFKPALKWLVNKHLSREIQGQDSGHCSVEDAIAALELVQLKLKKGAAYGVVREENESLFTRLARNHQKAYLIDRPSSIRKYSAAAVNCVQCSSDAEVLQKLLPVISQNERNFVWTQFLDLHQYYNNLPVGEDADEREVVQLLRAMDKAVGEIYDALPPHSILLGLTGHGSPVEMRRFSKDHEVELEQAVRHMSAGLSFIATKPPL